MKANQKYVQKKNGINYEALLFPMEYLTITQGDNEGTHLGTYAIDNAGKDLGIDPVYAPCTMKCMAIDAAHGNAVWFQSVNIVILADGSLDYVTFMFIHDDQIKDLAVGKVFVQGTQCYDEGKSGEATGNHVHMEVAKGKFNKMYDRNTQGTWHLPNNMPIENACFMNDTIIKKGVAKWQYLK